MLLKLLTKYKKRINKDYLEEVTKGLIITYLEAFVKDLEKGEDYGIRNKKR